MKQTLNTPFSFIKLFYFKNNDADSFRMRDLYMKFFMRNLQIDITENHKGIVIIGLFPTFYVKSFQFERVDVRIKENKAHLNIPNVFQIQDVNTSLVKPRFTVQTEIKVIKQNFKPINKKIIIKKYE